MHHGGIAVLRGRVKILGGFPSAWYVLGIHTADAWLPDPGERGHGRGGGRSGELPKV
jgi:hypothetical protein